MADWSLYQCEKELAAEQQRIKNAKMSVASKRLLHEFDRACLIAGLGMSRRKKLLSHMRVIATELLEVPLDRADRASLQDVVARIESRTDWKLWTKSDYKVALRRFYKWHVQQENWASDPEYPQLVKWIRSGLKRKDKCSVRAADLLTEEEVVRMIEVTRNPRNRAFIALLYELGARISEIGTMRVGDVSRDEHSFLIDLEGKTGKRLVREVLFASHIVTWLNLHPRRADPRAPLWFPLQHEEDVDHLGYRTFNQIIREAAEAAGITKRIYPHLFRHSRSTHVLATGKMNEAQAKSSSAGCRTAQCWRPMRTWSPMTRTMRS